MNPNQDSEETIFEAARELATPEERAAYLAKACGGDARLRERIENMLRDDLAAREFFDTKRSEAAPPDSPGGTVRVEPSSEQLGASIDRYKLREKIGEGGCGVVYVAEQEQPVRRRVALKIIKLGMDTKSVVARFEAERQALAMMDHPNIAKVIDAGTTDTGRPYFVMELVRGVKLTDYCRQHDLPVSARLDLFIKICSAVQHAHQKGIIHRDLKPSNILVTLHDGVPVPKIIDFGIAKATEGRLTEHTVYTQLHQFIGTPAYMSPEQAEMSGLDIDTRSDIYSLGVLLYELLTSQTPFDPKELLRAGLDELRRKIREDEPPRPSTRLSTMMDADLTTIAKHYDAEPPKLINLLRGDLDWIVMKALEKDRTRRYETANGMAMDIERFLHNEPVLARPPSRIYRFTKFARRNRPAFAAATAVTAAILLGLVVSAWQAIRATRAQRAEQNARLAADESRNRESEQRGVAEANARKATESESNTQRLLYAADMKLVHAAWEEGNLSRMIRLLEAHRPKPGEAEARGFEYFHFQELAKGEQEQTLSGHTNSVLTMAVSPDGKWLASRGETDTRLWDLTRRTVVAVWPSIHGPFAEMARNVYGISFSHDSRFLAFPSDQGLMIYHLPSRQTRLLTAGAVEKPLFSPVTNLIAFNSGSNRTGIRIMDYVANKLVGASESPRAIWCWSPDGARLLAGAGGGTVGYLEWWDVSTVKCVETDHAGQYLFGAAVSPDGRVTAAADWQGEIWLLETPGGKTLGKMDCGDIRTSALAFSPDGKLLATASRDQAILIWSVESRQCVRQLRGHHAKVTSLAYAPDGQLLISGDLDGKVMLWDTAAETRRLQIANRLGGFGVSPPQFSPDGKLLALRLGDRDCSILDAATLQAQSPVKGRFITFSPDSSEMAFFSTIRGQGALQIMKTGAPTCRATIPLALDPASIGTPRFSPDGRFFVVGNNSEGGGKALFNAATGERLLFMRYSKSADSPSCFLPDGQTWVCATGSALELWNLDSRKKTRSLDCGGPVLYVAPSRDGRYLAASRQDSRLLLWDLSSEGAPEVFTGHQAPVWALDFSPDGRTLVSGGEDRCLKLWDLAARREIASFVQEKPVYWVAFSPDNEALVFGGIGSYQVWRAPRGEAAPAFSKMPLPDPPATSVWRVPDGESPMPPQMLAEKAGCISNLLKIHAAVMAYQKDHQQMPDWLGDLVPKYLPDTNCLVCPVHAATSMASEWLPIGDPKVKTSYSYEFCARTNQFADPFGLAEPGDTMKAWKTRQFARYGGVVPVLRCAEHGAVLNVTCAGELVESPQRWEDTVDAAWRAKNPAEAEKWYQKKEQEGNSRILNSFAWRWATSGNADARDGRAAVRFAEKAAALTERKDPDVLDTLSAAYAEAGQFDKSVSNQVEAISLLKRSPVSEELDARLRELQTRLELYRQQRPYREEF
jgi:WD40 repeat protein/serine/threonine protein kinase